MSIENNFEGTSKRGPSAAAKMRAFEFNSSAESRGGLIKQYKEMKTEMAKLIEQQDSGKALREKLGSGSRLNQGEGEKIESDLGKKIAYLREDMLGIEKTMETNGIKSEEYRVN